MYNVAISICMAVTIGLIFRDVNKANPKLSFGLLGWFLVLATIASTSFFEDRFRVFPPMAVRFTAGLLLTLIGSLFIPRVRETWASIPTERILLWHWQRAPIGIFFLLAAASGELAPQFGHRAGTGDIIAGVGAVLLVMAPALRRRLPLLAWSIIGTLDLVMALGTALLTVYSPIQVYPHAEQMRILTHFPFPLVPSFFVPIMLFTHLLVFARTLSNKPGEPQSNTAPAVSNVA